MNLPTRGPSRRLVAAALPLLLAPALLKPKAAVAQSWPAKPVKLVVPFGVGGTTDLLARILAQIVSEQTGQPIVVENKTGASGTIGSAEVARAAPDGHTLLVATPSTHAIVPNLGKVPYDAVADFTPIAHLADSDLLLLMAPNFEAKNLAELVELGRSRPGFLNFASNGVGTIGHLVFELLSREAGITMNHVPYKNSASAIADVSSGLVHMTMDVPATGIPHITAGRLRGLAIAGPRRSSVAPDIPTISEVVPGVSAVAWFGLYGPKGMNADVAVRIHAAFARALREPRVAERLPGLGLEPGRGSPADFAAIVAKDSALWGGIIRTRGIKAE
jgi:tripartite-type tricarboxylate transporter receptor subunit TctC